MNQAQPPHQQQPSPTTQASSTTESPGVGSSNPSLSHYTSLLKNDQRVSGSTGRPRSATRSNQRDSQKKDSSSSRSLGEETASSQSQTQEQNQYYPQSQLEESQIAPWMYKPLPEEDILTWIAPSRPFKKRNKKYYTTTATIALLISLILGFAGQLAAIAVVIAVAFLAYILSVVPPQDVHYKITTWGIRIENNLYYWEELGRFWFSEKYGEKLLNIESARFPNRVTMLLNGQDEEIIKIILSEVLLNQKPEPTLYEKAASWLQEKIPLEIEE